MPINIVQTAVPLAIGVVDDFLEKMDRENRPARTESFQNATDLGRLAGWLAGLGMQVFTPQYASYGVLLNVATGPLLAKSVTKALGVFVPKLASPAAREVAFAPRREAGVPSTGSGFAWAPKPIRSAG